MPRYLVTAAIVLACGIPASAAADPPLFGFNDNSVAWHQTSAANDARLAAQAGATTARIAVDWGYVEPSQDYWVWTLYDQIYQASLAKGIKPIFELVFAPPWARDAGVVCSDNCNYPPAPEHLGDWGSFAAAVATRYPQLAAIEIWNEPNIQRYWTTGVDAARYVTVVKAARDAIRAAGSSIPVLAGALGNGPKYDVSDQLTFRTFLGRMYTAGLKGNADGISIHDYPDDVDAWQFYKTLIEIRDVRAYFDDDATPIWITETGITTTGSWPGSLGDYGQAVVHPRLYRLVSGMPDVRSMVVQSLVNPPYDPSSPESGFGLLDGSLNPKPGYCAFATFFQTGYQCPSSVTMPADNPDQNRRWEAQDLVQRAADAALKYHEQTGGYLGLDPAVLHAMDPAISSLRAMQTDAPGPSADPSRMLVAVAVSNGIQVVLICNTSRSTVSYCIRNPEGYRWIYGSATGTVGAAGTATNQGKSMQW